MTIDQIASDIADEDDEEEDELEEEHDHKKIEARSETYIDFMSNNMGQDFALRIKGKDMAACKRIFDELFHKIKKSSAPKPVKNDASYH